MRNSKLIVSAAVAIGAIVGVGMSAVPAMAADMAVKAQRAAPIVAGYSWTGCYIGVEGGGAQGSSRHVSGEPTRFGFNVTNSYDVSGGLVGAEAGCNYQADRWVFGVEGDWSWTNLRGGANDIAPFFATAIISGTEEKWIATARGRIGFLATPMLLLYATGGAAWASVDATVDARPAGTGFLRDNRDRWGGTVGGGGEYALGGGWSAKAEYLYVKFTAQQYNNPPQFLLDVRKDVPLENHIFRVGLNYKFGNAAVVARY
jgi:outer membrane immunogenic protein